MEMGIRGWMIAIGILLVLAVLLDGYRRMRNDRRGAIRMSLKMGGGFDKEDTSDSVNHELPNGGARVIAREQSPEDLGQKYSGYAADNPNDGLPSMSARPEGFDSSSFVPENLSAFAEESLEPVEETVFPEPPTINERVNLADAIHSQSPNNRDSQGSEPEELVVINVMAKNGSDFVGEDLLHILLACDLRLGKMNILHRYEKEHGKGAIQFSIANVLEPGTFDMDNIRTFATPGITFFMTLPGPEEPTKAFEYMVETAQCVAKNLDGEFKR